MRNVNDAGAPGDLVAPLGVTLTHKTDWPWRGQPESRSISMEPDASPDIDAWPTPAASGREMSCWSKEPT